MNSNPVARSALREILLVTQHGHYNSNILKKGGEFISKDSNNYIDIHFFILAKKKQQKWQLILSKWCNSFKLNKGLQKQSFDLNFSIQMSIRGEFIQDQGLVLNIL